MDPRLDKWAGVLGSSIVHWHSWEQYSDREMEFGKIEGNLGMWEKDIGDYGADSGTKELGHSDMWG